MKNFENTNGALVLRLLKMFTLFLLSRIIAVLLFPLGLVCWLLREESKNKTWQDWYAWRPVKLEDSEDYVWFKTIQRYESWLHGGEYSHRCVKYRLKENAN